MITSIFIALIKQTSVITILSVSVIFFSIVLILVLRKSYKLKSENEKLMKATDHLLDDTNKEYTDFTEGHMYSNTTKND